MAHWIAHLLGWVSTLGGVPLEHGQCWIPWWNEDRFAYECEFDPTTCDDTGCGAEMSAFEATIEAYDDRIWSRGRFEPRWHRPGYTIRVRGRVPLHWDEPYVSTGDHMNLDCFHAELVTRSGQVPVVHVQGDPLEPGTTTIPSPQDVRLRDGDILIPADDPSHTTPVLANLPSGPPGHFRLGWPWDGAAVDDWSLSLGALIVIEGEWTEHGSCEVLCTGKCRWRPDGSGRQTPATVVRVNGRNNTTRFVTMGFEHPGDYQQANGRSPGWDEKPRAVGYARFLGNGRLNSWAIAEHAARGARGAVFLNLVGAMQIAPEMTLGGAYRYALFAGNTQDLRLAVRNEGVYQLLWAPQGCVECQVTDPLPEQAHLSGTLPWISIGRRGDGRMSSLQVLASHVFAYWRPPYRTLIHSDEPLALSILGSGQNWRGLDLAPGSIVQGGFTDIGTPRRPGRRKR